MVLAAAVAIVALAAGLFGGPDDPIRVKKQGQEGDVCARATVDADRRRRRCGRAGRSTLHHRHFCAGRVAPVTFVKSSGVVARGG
jgi:hypothetical protein